jgi:DNA-binding transcriptional LysR family regulator
MGISHAPLFFEETRGSKGELERVLPDWEVTTGQEPQSGVFAIFPGGKQIPAKTRVFIDYLIEMLR